MAQNYRQMNILLSMPSGAELLVIVVLVLLLFGGKKIPELMRGLGQGIREFNTAKGSIKSQIEEGMREQPTPPSTTDKPNETSK